MSHYYLKDDSLKNIEYDIKFSINNVNFHLLSNNGVFSKQRVDKGSYIFINSLIKLPIKGRVLDLGCGYGVIGLTLKYFNKNIDLTLSDVNETCLELSKLNFKKYMLDSEFIHSDGFINLFDTYDYILFNPPISIGKDKIFKIYDDVYNHLNKDGHFLIVIRKDKGALSHIKYLESIKFKINLINKDKGYYIYESIK
ncbi:MAG: class I SAM-dependent methyltransferase [Bacillales bacterium]